VLGLSFLHSVVDLGVPIYEKFFRTIVVYLAIYLLLRLGGKRTAAQLNSFDLVVLLLLSNVVQNAIIGPDNSLLGGLIGAIALVATNDLILRIVHRSARLDRLVEGTRTRLIENGRFVASHLRKVGIRSSELDVAIRRQGAESVHQVHAADLYPSGALVVDMMPESRDAVAGDIARLERKLDTIIASLGASAS
jgi:uncharacterized membrane protein YcaP (DUF421 family)